MVINVMVAVDSGAPCRRAIRARAPRLATGVLCEVKIDNLFRLCLVQSTTDQLVDVVLIRRSTADATASVAAEGSWRRVVFGMARLLAKNVGAMAGL